MIGFLIRTDKPTDMERSIESCNRRSVEAESSLTYMAGTICAARRVRGLLVRTSRLPMYSISVHL